MGKLCVTKTMKKILLVSAGEETREGEFGENDTVGDILSYFEVKAKKNDEISINQRTVTLNTVPVAGQMIYISKGTTGSY